MTKSTIVNAKLTSIDANPFRSLADYPYVEAKLEALQASYEDVGVWEGVIARKKAGRYQLAFGHHRVHAAELAGHATIPLIVRDLTDEQMLQFMGRENLEDYNADFLTMLETWEAAVGFNPVPGDELQVIDLARLLGWTRQNAGQERVTHTADACHKAHLLIKGKHLSRRDLKGLSVDSVEQLVSRTTANLKRIEETAKRTGATRAEVKEAQKQVTKAAKVVAKDVKEGITPKRDIKTQVDVQTYRHAKEAKKQTPLFEEFGLRLANQICKMLNDDSAAEKIAEIKKVVAQVETDTDKAIIRRINYELGELGERVTESRIDVKKFGSENVVNLRAIK